MNIFTLTKLIGVEGARHVPFVQPPTSSLVIERLQSLELLYFSQEYAGMKLTSKPTIRANTFLVASKSCKLWNPLPLLSVSNSKIIIERFIDVNKYSLNCVRQQTWEQDYKAAMWSVELCVRRVHYPCVSRQ